MTVIQMSERERRHGRDLLDVLEEAASPKQALQRVSQIESE
jgi:hypothetical protein